MKDRFQLIVRDAQASEEIVLYADDEHSFCDETGEPLDPEVVDIEFVYHIFKAIMDSAGVPTKRRG